MLIGAPFAWLLNALGLPYAEFLTLMFFAGALADLSYLWDADQRGNVEYSVYRHTHRHIVALYAHYWCPFVWAHNLHVWIDHGTGFHVPGQEYWTRGTTGYYVYIVSWVVLLVCLAGYILFLMEVL